MKKGSNPSATGGERRGHHGWTEPGMQFPFGPTKAKFMEVQSAKFYNKIYQKTRGIHSISPKLSIICRGPHCKYQDFMILHDVEIFSFWQNNYPEVESREAWNIKLNISAPFPPWLSNSILQRHFCEVHPHSVWTGFIPSKIHSENKDMLPSPPYLKISVHIWVNLFLKNVTDWNKEDFVWGRS